MASHSRVLLGERTELSVDDGDYDRRTTPGWHKRKKQRKAMEVYVSDKYSHLLLENEDDACTDDVQLSDEERSAINRLNNRFKRCQLMEEICNLSGKTIIDNVCTAPSEVLKRQRYKTELRRLHNIHDSILIEDDSSDDDARKTTENLQSVIEEVSSAAALHQLMMKKKGLPVTDYETDGDDMDQDGEDRRSPAARARAAGRRGGVYVAWYDKDELRDELGTDFESPDETEASSYIPTTDATEDDDEDMVDDPVPVDDGIRLTTLNNGGLLLSNASVASTSTALPVVTEPHEAQRPMKVALKRKHMMHARMFLDDVAVCDTLTETEPIVLSMKDFNFTTQDNEPVIKVTKKEKLEYLEHKLYQRHMYLVIDWTTRTCMEFIHRHQQLSALELFGTVTSEGRAQICCRLTDRLAFIKHLALHGLGELSCEYVSYCIPLTITLPVDIPASPKVAVVYGDPLHHVQAQLESLPSAISDEIEHPMLSDRFGAVHVTHSSFLKVYIKLNKFFHRSVCHLVFEEYDDASTPSYVTAQASLSVTRPQRIIRPVIRYQAGTDVSLRTAARAQQSNVAREAMQARARRMREKRPIVPASSTSEDEATSAPIPRKPRPKRTKQITKPTLEQIQQEHDSTSSAMEELSLDDRPPKVGGKHPHLGFKRPHIGVKQPPPPHVLAAITSQSESEPDTRPRKRMPVLMTDGESTAAGESQSEEEQPTSTARIEPLTTDASESSSDSETGSVYHDSVNRPKVLNDDGNSTGAGDSDSSSGDDNRPKLLNEDGNSTAASDSDSGKSYTGQTDRDSETESDDQEPRHIN